MSRPNEQPSEPSGLPLCLGASGAAVLDLHRRLGVDGAELVGDVFDESTAAALRRFQDERGLVVDGVCGAQTWGALVEADYRLGDRMLYLRSPMTRGEDVAELQQRLGSLGFDAGWVDGIFGPDTQRAVREFQHNCGLLADGVVGRASVTALERLSARQAGHRTVTEVREVEVLRSRSGGLRGRRIVVGEAGGLPAVAQGLARRLRADGAEVMALALHDEVRQARLANDWDGEVFVGVTLTDAESSVAYFATAGFESVGGRALARRCGSELSSVLQCSVEVAGKRLPILRHTRMPAVWCRIGPPPTVVERTPGVADALRRALSDWCLAPVEPGELST